MKSVVAASLAIAVVLLSACSDPAAKGPVFIALQSDFSDFRSWSRVFVGDGELEGHPAGARYGYLKQHAPAGSTEYPVGTMIVKTVERDGGPKAWDIFAMVKRGGNYNKSGAINWEYFTLLINEDDIPVIFSRGDNPSDAEHDGGPGHGYADPTGSGVTCNRCHGTGTESTDHVLSPALAPGN